MAEGTLPPPSSPSPTASSAGPALLETLLDSNNSGSSGINNNSKLCGMLGISMPCEAAGHDFSSVRKELEFASSIAAHYTAAGLAEKGDSRDHHHQRVGSYKIEDRERTDNCSRSNSPTLNELNNQTANCTTVVAALRSREKMSPLSLPAGSPVANPAAAAAAAAAAAQVHLNGTMQDMLNLQKLQSLAQLTSGAVLPGLGLPTAGLPSAAAALLNNSPLNLSLGAQSHSPVMGALAAAPPQPLPTAPTQMPQLILASGQIVQGIQGAQLLIPTAQGIATQTILAIPVGQQVVSSVSSENLLQCLNFNTTVGTSNNNNNNNNNNNSSNNNFNDILNHHHPHAHLHNQHHPGNAAFAAAAAAAAAAAVATRESPVTVNSPINSTSLLTNPLALAAAAVANSNNHHHHPQHHHHHHHHHQQHPLHQHLQPQQQQQQQQQTQQQAKHLTFSHQSPTASSSAAVGNGGGVTLSVTPSMAHHHGSTSATGQHVVDKIRNLTAHERASSERSTPEMHRIKLESPKQIASPILSTPQRPSSNSFASVFEKSPQLKRNISPSIAPCAVSNSSTSSNGSSSNGSSLISGISNNVGQIHISKNLTSPHHSPSESTISRISTSNGEITVTKSQAPLTPPLSVQKNHPASMHFNPSISPQPLIHHARDQQLHHHHPHLQHHHQQQQQQLSMQSAHGSPQSATVASAASVGENQLQKEHKLCTSSSSSSITPTGTSTPGVISLTLEDMEQKISPHSSLASGSSLSKRHRSLTPPPRKHSPAGSVQLSQDDEEDEDNNSNHNELEDSPNELTINQTNCNVVDGIDLDDIKEFAKAFKLRRLSLGLTQTQVGQALSVTEGPAYSQSAICRFEKLDITPKSAQKIKPVLERWMKEAEESHSSRYKSGQNHLTDFIGVEPSKKRKRRTSFTPQALELLNGHFERNTHPSGTEITGLAHQLGYEREVIRIWFCNKRQALKNTVRMMSKNFKMETS
ncbi:POU domain, class 6, transcription factor 2 isoform X3 [Malaya genurostris]|uniref:POU domain, class 6, transcription factor 2 isoform X3 n=1 Tax=Malaya genurostris TaxID=325434 RepID=UPI0026F385A8|nr:POU domain, class 6, transcription factor 2 isoform X3 [Malaya genurostris]